MQAHDSPLPPDLTERVLQRLGLSAAPPPTAAGLGILYDAWCRRVPFDNVRKRLALHRREAAPFPGDEAADFFEAWLGYGTGGTCWAGNGALCSLLSSLGFDARRGVATMLASANAPPNHGTVVVGLDGRRYLVDASMLFGEPLELDPAVPHTVPHPAWGASSAPRLGSWVMRWRPLHAPDGIDCRIERVGATAADFRGFHEKTRPWSPFNFAVYARLNRGRGVLGMAFGNRVDIDPAGRFSQRPLSDRERVDFLVQEIGIDERLAGALPPDAVTPPPPRG